MNKIDTIEDKSARLLFRFFRYTPLSMRSTIGSLLGRIYSWLPTRDRKFARLQLKVMLPEADPDKIIGDLYSGLGRNILETFSTGTVLDRSRIELSDECEKYLQELHSSPRPVITLTAHTGNWDLMGAYFLRRGLPIVTIGKRAKSAVLHSLLEQIRASYGILTVWRNDPSETRDLVRHLKEKRIIAALIDQDTRVKSAMIPFMGYPARHPVSLITLGKRLKADFVASFIVRTGPYSFSIAFTPLPADGSEEEILQAYSNALEAVVRKHPAQWVWFHKRWRSHEEDSRLSSDEYLRWLSEEASKKNRLQSAAG